MNVLPMTGRAIIVWPPDPPHDAASSHIQAVAETIREALRNQDAKLYEANKNGIGFSSPIAATIMRGHQLNGISSGIIYLEIFENIIVVRCKLNAAPILIYAALLISLLTVLLHTPLLGARWNENSSDFLYSAPVLLLSIKYFVTKFAFPRWLRRRILDDLAANV